MMPENLVIYHANCSDGMCAAWVAWKCFARRGEVAEYRAWNYGEKRRLSAEDFAGRKVWFLDFSLPREDLIFIKEHAKALIVLDHHKTAEEALRGLDFCTFDMDKAGCRLAWEHFFPEEILPLRLVKYCEDRDLWRWKLPFSREVSMMIRLQGTKAPEDFVKWEIFSARLETGEHLSYGGAPLGDGNQGPLAKEGAAILASNAIIEEQHVERAVRSCLFDPSEPQWTGRYKSSRPPWVVWQCNATVLFSEIAGKLAERGDADFGCCWFVRQDGQYQYSLRSLGDFDVSLVAKAFGGGGHKAAAGFESNRLLFRLVD